MKANVECQLKIPYFCPMNIIINFIFVSCVVHWLNSTFVVSYSCIFYHLPVIAVYVLYLTINVTKCSDWKLWKQVNQTLNCCIHFIIIRASGGTPDDCESMKMETWQTSSWAKFAQQKHIPNSRWSTTPGQQPSKNKSSQMMAMCVLASSFKASYSGYELYNIHNFMKVVS